MEIIVDPQAAQGWMFAGGFKQIDGKWYYFCSDGSMSANTAIDGYTIGPDGAGSLLRTVSGKSIKRRPNRYRKEEEFYPLQLRYVLQESPADLEGENGWQQRIACATDADIPAWMEPVRLVIDGFPHLDEERYFARLRVYIRNGRALILKDGDTAVGIMAFDEITGDRLSGGASAIPEKGVAREPVQ